MITKHIYLCVFSYGLLFKHNETLCFFIQVKMLEKKKDLNYALFATIFHDVPKFSCPSDQQVMLASLGTSVVGMATRRGRSVAMATHRRM